MDKRILRNSVIAKKDWPRHSSPSNFASDVDEKVFLRLVLLTLMNKTTDNGERVHILIFHHKLMVDFKCFLEVWGAICFKLSFSLCCVRGPPLPTLPEAFNLF